MNPKKLKPELLRKLLLILGITVALTAIWSCQPKKPAPMSAPLLEGMGDHQLAITTDSELAQRFFNQGLTLAYGFNHREAARAFREAINQDPDCAMCHWGLALVQGPNINAPMDPTSLGEVFLATQKAQQLRGNASDWEQALIEALAHRYPDSTTVDRVPFDEDYAQAMESVYKTYPDHQEIATLYGESLMDLHPWDLYEHDGTPKEWTPQIVEVLENSLERWPQNPGTNHLYIHAVEASNSPERANVMAQRLEELVPASGHLVHMPSHIYIRTGQYHQGSVVNQLAMDADSIYIANCNAQGMVPLIYYPHNIHFLAATAALEGRGDISINAAYQLASKVDKQLMKDPDWVPLQHFFSIPYYILVKFGQWDRILEMPLEDVPYPRAVLHYARGMAYANQGNLDQAVMELEDIRQIRADSTLNDLIIWDLNKITDLVDIATLVLTAEIDVKNGRIDQAINSLNAAIAIEDQLNYMEPPDWFFSVRHTLGTVLLRVERYQEAEKIYSEDLHRLPENGWALSGLYLSLINQNKNEEAEAVKSRFEQAWQWANIDLDGSMVSHLSYNSYGDLDLFNDKLALSNLDQIPLRGKP